MSSDSATPAQHSMFVTYHDYTTVTERVIARTPEEAIRRVRDGYGEEISHESVRPTDFVTSDEPPTPTGCQLIQDSAAPQ